MSRQESGINASESEIPQSNRFIEFDRLDYPLEIKPVNEREGIYQVDMIPLMEQAEPNWREEILHIAQESKLVPFKPGAVDTSLATRGADPTVYRVTNGIVIGEKLPWLYDLCVHDIPRITSAVAGRPMQMGPARSALNINYTEEGHYEPHADRDFGLEELTAMLYLEHRTDKQGGKTVLWNHSTLGPPTEREILLSGFLQRYIPLEEMDVADAISRWEHLPLGKKTTILRETGIFALRRKEENLAALVTPELGKLVIFPGARLPHEVTAIDPNFHRCTLPEDTFSGVVPEDKEFDEAIGLGKKT